MKTNYYFTATCRRSKVCIKSALLLLFLLVSAASFAQVTNYSFSQSQGSYIPLTDNASVIATPTAQTATGSLDDQVFTIDEGTIPFPFTFNNTDYTGLQVYANGFIAFGEPEDNSSSPISSYIEYSGVISALAADIHALFELNELTGSISYETIGTAPNREFVIQWSHFKPYSSTTSTTKYFDFNFQIRLKEDNTLAIVYDLNVTGAPTSISPQVGLRGQSSSDYDNRAADGTNTSNWSTSTSGTSSYSSITTNSTSLPTSGLTFSWAPPALCTTPTVPLSALNLTYSGSTVTGTFTATDADSYLVVRTADGAVADTPENGVTYTTGAGLNGTIVAVTSTPTFTSGSLAGNTAYTYTVFAYNHICASGPLYNTAGFSTATITTCPSVPTAVTAGNPTLTTFELNWVTPAGGTAEEYHYTVEVATDDAFTDQIEGSPFTVSSEETNLFVQNLEHSTKYYYRIATVNSCTGAFVSGSASTSCEATTILPFSESFNDASIPACWTTALVGGTTNWSPAASNDGVPSPKSGARFASKTWTNSDALFISPQFDMSAQTADLRIKVWIYRNATDGHVTDVVKFHVSATNTLTDAVELLSVGLRTTAEPAVSAGGWYQYTAQIPSSFTSAPFYIIAQGTTAGSYSSYGIGFDDFVLEQVPAILPASVEVTTLENAATTIVTNEGTLQLQATITPAQANQAVTWSITNGTGTATISPTGLVSAVTNGTVIAKATSNETNTLSGELEITITNQLALICTPTYGEDSVEAITLVEFGGFSNTSPASSEIEYESFTNITGNVTQGQTAPIRVKGNTEGASYTNYFMAYFDWNNNRIFEDNEKTYLGSITASTGTDDTELTANIVVPADAVVGNIRMRVLKKYSSSPLSSINACNTSGYGQAEDYTVAVAEAVLGTAEFNKTKFTIYPNPTSGITTIDTQMEIKSVSIYNQLGQLLNNTSSKQIDLSNEPSGIYIIRTDFNNGQTVTSKIIKE